MKPRSRGVDNVGDPLRGLHNQTELEHARLTSSQTAVELTKLKAKALNLTSCFKRFAMVPSERCPPAIISLPREIVSSLASGRPPHRKASRRDTRNGLATWEAS